MGADILELVISRSNLAPACAKNKSLLSKAVTKQAKKIQFNYFSCWKMSLLNVYLYNLCFLEGLT